MGIVPELQNQHSEDHLPPSIFWEDNENKDESNQETEIANAARKIIAKKISGVGSKQSTDTAPKKLCVCAPTNHAGSFTCRLHRISLPQKSTTSDAKRLGGRSHERLKSDGQTQLSRFGRAATAAAMEYKEEEKLEPHQEPKKH